MPAGNALIAEKMPVPVDAGTPGEPPRAPAPSLVVPQPAPISIECATGARLTEIEADWLDLVRRAHEPNVFMDPAVVEVAQRSFHDDCGVTLLAWQGAGKSKTLVGLWAFSVTHPDYLPLPRRILLAPAAPHSYLATPVIDRDMADSALEAMLDFIARSDLPKLVALNQIRLDGPTMRALDRVLNARGTAPFVLAKDRRPVLASGLSAAKYFEKALSGSTRKKLRQHRRRLQEKGNLESKVWTAPDAVCRAFDDFLHLEAAGWKGRRGTAMHCKAAEAAFARNLVAKLACRGAASIHALYFDGRPISMQVVLRAGSVAFTWKTAYAETAHEYSPGMLLLEDYTRAFLADDTITMVDSCAYDERGFMSAWSERQEIGQVWLNPASGFSLRFFLLGHLQKVALWLRSVVKETYLWGRQWKKN